MEIKKSNTELPSPIGKIGKIFFNKNPRINKNPSTREIQNEGSIETIDLEIVKKEVNDEYVQDVDNIDYEYYNKKLKEIIESYNNTGDKVAAAAIFLATEFPRLPYFWGGGHEEVVEGIDPSWGTPKEVTSINDETTGTIQPYSLDCSGFVMWCLKNGGYDISDLDPINTGTEVLHDLGKSTNITETDINEVKPGDLAWKDGHIGVIIDTDSDKNEVTIAHCSGSGGGLEITTQSLDTGKITYDSVEVTNTGDKRVGSDLFTEIISIDYNN